MTWNELVYYIEGNMEDMDALAWLYDYIDYVLSDDCIGKTGDFNAVLASDGTGYVLYDLYSPDIPEEVMREWFADMGAVVVRVVADGDGKLRCDRRFRIVEL